MPCSNVSSTALNVGALNAMHSMPPLVNLHIDGSYTPHGHDIDDLFGEDIGVGKRKGRSGSFVEEALGPGATRDRSTAPDLAQIHASLWFTMADRPEEKLAGPEEQPEAGADDTTPGTKIPYEGFLSLDPVFSSEIDTDVKKTLTEILNKVVRLEGDLQDSKANPAVFKTYLQVQNPNGTTETRELRAKIGSTSEFSLGGTSSLQSFKNMILTRVSFASGTLPVDDSVALQPYPIVPITDLKRYRDGSKEVSEQIEELIAERKRYGTILSGRSEFNNAQLKRMADLPGCSFFLYSDMQKSQSTSPKNMQEAVSRIGIKIYRQLLANLQANMFSSRLDKLKSLSVIRWITPTLQQLQKLQGPNVDDVPESQEDEPPMLGDGEPMLGYYRRLPSADQIDNWLDKWLDWKGRDEKRQRDTVILDGGYPSPPEFFLEPSEVGAEEESSTIKHTDGRGQVISMTAYPPMHPGDGGEAPYWTNTVDVETERGEGTQFEGLASMYYCADYVKKTIHPDHNFEPPQLERGAPMVRLMASPPGGTVHTVYGDPVDHTINFEEATRRAKGAHTDYTPPQYALDGKIVEIERFKRNTDGEYNPEVKYGVIQRVWKLRYVSYDWLHARLRWRARLREQLASQNLGPRDLSYRTCFFVDGVFKGHFHGLVGDNLQFRDLTEDEESAQLFTANPSSTIHVVMN